MRIKKLSRAYSGSTYIVRAEGRSDCILIDAGVPTSYVGEESPVAVLLTHGHFDHILELERIRERFNAPVYIHAQEQEYLTTPALSLFAMIPSMEKTRMRPAEHVFENGQTLELAGLVIRVLHTPGHTRGSCCFDITDPAAKSAEEFDEHRSVAVLSRALFTGDTLFASAIGRTDFPGSSYPTMLQSLKRLEDFASTNGALPIFPGHEEFSRLSSALNAVAHFLNG